MVGKGRRKVGIWWVVWRAYSRWRWSKTLRSDAWTMNRMQRGRGPGVVVLEGP